MNFGLHHLPFLLEFIRVSQIKTEPEVMLTFYLQNHGDHLLHSESVQHKTEMPAQSVLDRLYL